MKFSDKVLNSYPLPHDFHKYLIACENNKLEFLVEDVELTNNKKESSDLDVFVPKKILSKFKEIAYGQGYILYVDHGEQGSHFIKFTEPFHISHIHLRTCIRNPFGSKLDFYDIEALYKKSPLDFSSLVKDNEVIQVHNGRNLKLNKVIKERNINNADNKLINEAFIEFIIKLILKLLGPVIQKRINVIITGADGSGKSTVVKELDLKYNKKILCSSKYMGLRTSFIWRSVEWIKLTKNNKAEATHLNFNNQGKYAGPSTAKLLSKILGLAYFVEYLIKRIYMRIRFDRSTRIVLHDRTYADYLLYKDDDFIAMLFKWIHKNDLIFYLNVEVQQLLDLKGEFDQNSYRLLTSRTREVYGKCGSLIVDNQRGALDITLNQIHRQIWKSLKY